MSDVCTKAVSANSITNGRVVTGVTPLGNYDSLTPLTEQQLPSPSGYASKLDTRLDDKDYYTTG